MKKRLLALLLAVLMIVTILPVSVLAAEANAEEGSGETTLTVEDLYPEPEEDDYFQLVNKAGVHLGYFKTIGEADAAWDDGYTIRLLKDYELTATWDVGKTRNKQFASDPAMDKSDDPLNDAVFDGQGHKLIANGFDAILVGTYAHWDCITFKNVVVVSSNVALSVAPGDGGQTGVIFENCQLYGGNSYYLFNPDFYEEAPAAGSSYAVTNTGMTMRLSITGADTVVAAWKGTAVEGRGGCIELVDGLYYSHEGAATVYNYGNSNLAAWSEDLETRHITIHGGTYINRKQAVVTMRLARDIDILGGTFIQTAELTESGKTASALLVGGYATGNNINGSVTLSGGHFYVAGKSGVTSLPVSMSADYSFLGLVGNPTFYGPTEWTLAGTTGELVGGVRVGDFNVLGAVTAASTTVTYDLPGSLTDVNFTTSYKQTVGMAADYSGAEALIYNKEGTLISGLNLDGTGKGMALTITQGAAYAIKAESQKDQVRTCFDYIPAYGKMVLQTNVTVPGVTNTLRGACGGAPITVDGQNQQFGFVREGTSGYMLAFNHGGNVILKDMKITNTHHGINLGGNGMQLKLTLDHVDMQVGANKNSSFCINTGDVELRITNGTTITQQGATSVFQLRGYSRIYVEDSTITGNGASQIFHKSPDRRNLNNNSAYYDWIDNDVVLVLDNAVVTTPSGSLDVLFNGQRTTAQTTDTANANYCKDQDEHRTTLTAINGTKLQFKALAGQMSGVTSLTIDTRVSVLDAEGTKLVEVENATYAVDLMKDGYTLQLAKDANYWAGMSLYLDAPAAKWTLDGNGAMLVAGAGGFSGNIGALEVAGNGSDCTVKNLLINGGACGFATGPDNNTDVNSLTLDNVQVYGSRNYYYAAGANTGSNARMGRITGPHNYVRIIGSDSHYEACIPSEGFQIRGQLAIYDGTFETTGPASAGVDDVFFVVQTYTNTTKTRNTTSLHVYGGTFTGGPATKSMIQTSNGANAVVLGGDFTMLASGAFSMLQPASANYGYMEIQGGNFYAPNTTAPIYKPVTAAKAYALLAGGTFYGQVAETGMVNGVSGTEYSSGSTVLDALFYGTRIDSTFTVTSEGDGTTAAATVNEVAYLYKTTIARTTAITADTATVAVYNGYDAEPRYYGGTELELELAFSAVGDGGKVVLLKDATVAIDHAGDTFFQNSAKTWGIETELFNHFVEWSFESPEGQHYTLTIQYVAPVTSSYFAFNVVGGNVTFKDITVYGNAAEFRGMAVGVSFQKGVQVNLDNTVIKADTQSTIKTFGPMTVNVYEGSYIYRTTAGSGAGIEVGYADSTVNVYGGVIGKTEAGTVTVPYGVGLFKSNSTLNVYGGEIWATFDAAAKIVDGADDCSITVYDGTLACNTGYGISVTDTTAKKVDANDADGDDNTTEEHTYYSNYSQRAVVNIHGGTVKTGTSKSTDSAGKTTYSERACVLLNANGATLNMTAGTLTNSSGWANGLRGVRTNMGKYYDSSALSNVFQGPAIYVNVTGGSITGVQYGMQLNPSKSSVITVSGGTHDSTSNFFHDNGTTTINLLAGNVTAGDSVICADGFGSTYNVGEKGKDAALTTSSNRLIGVNSGSGNAVNVYGGSHTGKSTDGVITVANGNTYNIYGGTVSGATGTDAIALRFVKSSTQSAAYYGATVTVHDGKLVSNGKHGAIYMNADFNPAGTETQLTIKGGEIEGAKSRGMQVFGAFKIAISGGTVSGAGCGLDLSGAGAVVDITGGTVQTKITLNAANGGCHNVPAAIHATKAVTVNISKDARILGLNNGTTKSRAIWTQSASTINISGGTIEAEYNCIHDNGTATVNMTGGLVRNTAGSVLCMNSAGVFNMTGGKIEASGAIGTGHNATYTFGGSAVVEAGSSLNFNGVGTAGTTMTVNIKDNARITVTDGNVINVPNSTLANVTVNISGGVISSNRNALWIGNQVPNFTLNMSGGVVAGTDKDATTGAINPVKSTINITGGILLAGYEASSFMGIKQDAANSITLPGAFASGTVMPIDKSADTVIFNDQVCYMWAYGAATDSTIAGAMKNGAQIRMVEGSNGIRFVTEYSASVLAKIGELAGEQEGHFGTLIVPMEDLLAAKGVFTHAALDAANVEYADIVATENGMHFSETTGAVTVRAALVNIKAENYELGLAAISYVKVGDTYYYGAFDSVVNARSVAQVATKALNDVNTVIGTLNGNFYAHASVVEGIEGYSRYNAAQQAVMAAYAGLTLKTEE